MKLGIPKPTVRGLHVTVNGLYAQQQLGHWPNTNIRIGLDNKSLRAMYRPYSRLCTLYVRITDFWPHHAAYLCAPRVIGFLLRNKS